MLAFHNEHIASCAFLTYFSPESNATPATSPTSAAQASLYNDKQSITGVAHPCGALSVRRMRFQQHPPQQQQHAPQRQSFGFPYPRLGLTQRLQLQRHQQRQSHPNLREFGKTQAIC
ncbi:hypothetical protein KR054_002765 [Drosophila jambulina]|nr:hypothetical protein KR054_002765 [Drosophila jambulina]